MKKRFIALFLCLTFIVALVAGCGTEGKDQTQKASQNTTKSGEKNLGKLVVAYSGGTCEAATYVAYHKGFFKKEGLDVELVKMDFNTLKTGIASGKVDATVGNFAWFKPIEQGLAIKLTGGIHAGCIQAVAPANSGIKTIKDLKGKTIGVDAIGGGPMISLSIELEKQGIDPKTDVSWKVYSPPQLSQAVKNKEIDAFAVWDPFGQNALDNEHYVRLLNTATDEPYKSGFCCYTVVSNKLVKENPEKAAAYTRAILKAAEWVGQHPDETAKIEVDNKYVSTDLATDTKLLKSYYWKPGIAAAKENVKYFVHVQKEQGILDPSTDEKELSDRIFSEVISDYK